MTAKKKESKVTAADFVGAWELVPAESKYAMQQVPQEAKLEIKNEKGGLFMRLEWVDHVGAKGEIDHSFPFKQAVMVNGTEHTLTLNDDGVLETVVQKDGEEYSRTRRTLSADGKKMELTQLGTLPNKESFSNVSVYRRVK
ncbi:MAG: hypothetical protein JNM17_36080 [Archangium sp.]|nr:hypothetical protein [Archangium sp.]